MSNRKYGNEMKNVVRFIPKGQTEMVDIYDQLNSNQSDSEVSEKSSRREFSRDKYFIRPSDEGYEDYFVDSEPETTPQKRRRVSKKSKSTKSTSQNKRNKKRIKKEDVEFQSKVLAREKRNMFVSSITPRREVLLTGIGIACMMIALYMGLSYYNISSKIIEIRYENLTLKQEYENKLYEKKELETKLESSNRSDRIEYVARTVLGMEYPRPDQIVYIKSN